MKTLLTFLLLLSVLSLYGQQADSLNNKAWDMSRKDTVTYTPGQGNFAWDFGKVYVVAAPTAPTSLIDSIQTDTQINLYWTDNSSDEDGFIIYRSLNDTLYTAIDSVSENVVTYSNTGLTANTAYYYKVSAYKASGSAASNKVGATTYHKEIGRYISGLTTALSHTQKAALNEFVDDITSGFGIDSLAQYFDIMYVLGGQTSESSLRNLVKRAHDATAENSATFTAFEGFQGNGTSTTGGYLSTHYNPNTQKVAYALNSASMGLYSRTDNVQNRQIMGSYVAGTPAKRIELQPAGAGDPVNSSFGLNDNTYGISSGVTNSLGMFVASRTDTNNIILYQNGISKYEKTNLPSSGIPDLDIYILAANGLSNRSNRQVAFAFMGKELTMTQTVIVTRAIEEYMDGNGKGVITEDIGYILDNGKVIFSWDDGSANQYPVFELFQEKGIKSTFYINSNWMGEGSHLTWAQTKTMYDAGMDIQDHFHDHDYMNLLDSATLVDGLIDAENDFAAQGMTGPEHIAYPYGIITPNKAYVGVRRLTGRVSASSTSIIYVNNDKYILPAVGIDDCDEARLAFIKTQIDYAGESKSACILYSHGISTEGYGLAIEYLEAIIDYAKANPRVDIITIKELGTLLYE